jgi:hypothetical protein
MCGITFLPQCCAFPHVQNYFSHAQFMIVTYANRFVTSATRERKMQRNALKDMLIYILSVKFYAAVKFSECHSTANEVAYSNFMCRGVNCKNKLFSLLRESDSNILKEFLQKVKKYE